MAFRASLLVCVFFSKVVSMVTYGLLGNGDHECSAWRVRTTTFTKGVPSSVVLNSVATHATVLVSAMSLRFY
ncbi:transmembrane protein, putative [Medicago truncatula]|uniref:Transmembrane protein, putative n=1 Tax=Medicago truncatula TaxID=3880 RepID=A0A072VI20_MEDTR|nr:transmembrane protein, putative [Medicago truncatula]